MPELDPYKKIGQNIKKFIANEICNDFPEINGTGVGVVVEEFMGRNLNEVSQEEVYESLYFWINLECDLSEEQKKEILMRIAEKFVKFKVIGKIKPRATKIV